MTQPENSPAFSSTNPSTSGLVVAPLATLRARRICFIKPSALGDVVQSLPILHALRYRFPTASITWVINEPLAPLIAGHGLVDDVIPFERQRFQSLDASSRRGIRDLAAMLARYRFDLAIDLQGLLRSAMVSLATKAPVRIGLASAREGAVYTYTHLAQDGPFETNAVDRYWSVVRLLGAGFLPKSFDLRLSDSEKAWARQTLQAWPRPWLAIHPGAKWLTKRLPADRLGLAASQWMADRRGTVMVLGAGGDEELAQAIRATMGGLPMLDLMGKTSLRQLAALLAETDLLLTNDSGPMHLAAALGTRTVSLFTCTSPIRSGPFGPGHAFWQTTVPCRASYVKECSHLSCMKQLQPEALLPLLDEACPARSSAGRAA
jgi:lipopolysaccharide heptosyltransferase I